MRVLLFLSFFFYACSGSPSVPKGVMPPKKMEAVLYDVIRADEMVDFLQMNDSTYRMFSRRTSFYDTIFQLHAVKKEDFQKSLTYYQGRPDLLKVILDDLQKKVTDTSGAKKGLIAQ
jgi:hypothetical protein